MFAVQEAMAADRERYSSDRQACGAKKARGGAARRAIAGMNVDVEETTEGLARAHKQCGDAEDAGDALRRRCRSTTSS